jgi:hypothetical protein
MLEKGLQLIPVLPILQSIESESRFGKHFGTGTG